MIRRLALAACGVLAAAALASCTTFTDNRVAARVGDAELSQDDIDELLGLDASTTTAAGGVLEGLTGDDGMADGDEVRTMLTRWIQAALLERAAGVKSDDEIASPSDLEDRLTAGLDDFVAAYADEAGAVYDEGVPATPMICLGAIPVAGEADADEVLAAIDGGMSFADAAAEFSIEPTLAGNGGVVESGGSECAPSGQLNPIIVEALSGSPAGTPATISIEELVAVVQQRPWSELSDASQAAVAESAVPEERYVELVESADVYVDPRYGYWDPATASVQPLGG